MRKVIITVEDLRNINSPNGAFRVVKIENTVELHIGQLLSEGFVEKMLRTYPDRILKIIKRK
jgi:hypothetical protein